MNKTQKSFRKLLIVVVLLLSAVILSGCTPTNSYYYHYDRGDCKPTRFDYIDDNLDIEFRWKDDSLYLRWEEYEGDGDFYGYYIMRDDALTCPYFYTGSDYFQLISKKDRTYYKDDSVKSGDTYYYRVCVMQTDKEVACGSVEKVEIY